MRKRLLAWLVCLALVLALFPTGVLAADDTFATRLTIHGRTDDKPSSDIDLMCVPTDWTGEYDGYGSSTKLPPQVVPRCFSIHIDSISENGSISGIAYISPSSQSLIAIELGEYAAYYFNGSIDKRDGCIELQGYSWIDYPHPTEISTHTFFYFKGYLDLTSDPATITGTTTHGLWNMHATDDSNSIKEAAKNTCHFNGHSYKYYFGRLNWQEAKAYCESVGGHLVTVSSLEEERFVHSLAEKNDNAYAMIGLSDTETEGAWEWVTGEPFRYSCWDQGEPNNDNNKDFALISGEDGTWKVGQNQQGSWPFICEWDDLRGGNADIEFPVFLEPRTYSDVTIHYKSTEGSTRSMTGREFRDDWLLTDSYVYNHALATMSLWLDMAAFEFDDPYQTNGDARIQLLYHDLGFGSTAESGYYSIGYGIEDDDTIAMAVSAKYIGDTPIVVVTLRGGGYGPGGWAGDFFVGSQNEYHEGFFRAAEFVEGELINYLEDRSIDMSKARIWLTGYSRSAATANLLSQFLEIDHICARENIYTYTFATPNNQTHVMSAESTNNIFSIVNPIDIVPMVPCDTWSFGKAGIVAMLPYLADADDDAKSRFLDNFRLLSGTDYIMNPHQRDLVDLLFNSLETCIDSRETYVSYFESAIIKLIKEGDLSGFDYFLSGYTTMDRLISQFTSKNPILIACAIRDLGRVCSTYVSLHGKADPGYLFMTKLNSLAIGYLHEIMEDERGICTELVEFIVKMVKDGFVVNGSIFHTEMMMQHWPEVYMAWMLSTEGIHHISNSKYAFISCSVDVEVYNASGQLVARTYTESMSCENEDGAKETLYISVVDETVTVLDVITMGEEKLFLFPDDQNYTIRIKTNSSFEEGDSMTYMVTETVNGSPVNMKVYYDVPLHANTVLTAEISQAFENSTLSDGNAVIEESISYNAEDVLRYIPSMDATCTEAGSIECWTDGEHYYADPNREDEIGRGEIELAAAGHDWGEWYISDATAATQPGIEQRECIICGEKESRKTDPSGQLGSLDNFASVQTYHGQFEDVKPTSWYYGSVAKAYELGLVNGVSETSYNPLGDIKVSETIVLAARIHSIYMADGTDFTALAGEKYYMPYVRYAVVNGIIRDGEYEVYNVSATREQFAAILAHSLPEYELEAMNSVPDNFIPDVPMSSLHSAEIYLLYRAGILVGNDAAGTFTPSNPIKRSEAAAIILRLADTSERKQITLG